MMTEKLKQRIFNMLGWLNILVFTPVLFITIIFNAQTYIMQLRTDKATLSLLLYVIQLLMLLCVFIPSVLLQMKRSEKHYIQILFILGFESSCLFIFMILNQLMFHAPMHIYGGVFLLFLQSYIGIGLVIGNIIVSCYVLLTNKVKVHMSKSACALLFSFLCLTIVLYILK